MITLLANLVFFVLGVAMSLGAVALWVAWFRRVFLWQKAQGKVVEPASKDGDAQPIIEFTDGSGKPFRFSPKPTDPSPNVPGPGEQVKVAFNPSNPAKAEVHAPVRFLVASIFIAFLGAASTGAALRFNFSLFALIFLNVYLHCLNVILPFVP